MTGYSIPTIARGRVAKLSHDKDDKIDSDTNISMFMVDVLRYGRETPSGIVTLLNDRGSVGWRNFVTLDFTVQIVMPVLRELIWQGLVQVVPEDIAPGEFHAWSDGADLEKNLDHLWVRLTEKGRQALDEWDPPKSLEDYAVEAVKIAPTQSVETIAQIADPMAVLQKIVEMYPGYESWVTKMSCVRHFLIDTENRIYASRERVWENVARHRLDRGLSDIGEAIVRHIVLDPADKVAGDYFGPASLDPLEA